MTDNIKIIEKIPDDSDFTRISDGLDEYNSSSLFPVYEPKSYAFNAVRENGEIIGGLIIKYAFNACEIKLLHVDRNMRGNGVGQKLISKAEDYARKHNMGSICIWTFSWQGEGFYEKCGFKQIFKIPLTGNDETFTNEQQYNILYYKDL